MLRLWKLVLLCGLLTGTSASVFKSFKDGLGNAVKKMEPVLDDVQNGLQDFIGKVKENKEMIVNSDTWQSAQEVLQKVESVVTDGLSAVLSSVEQAFELKIYNVHILNIKPELSPDGAGLTVGLPVSANVDLSLPLVGKTLNLAASLDFIADIRLEPDDNTGIPKVVVRNCSSNEDSISLELLGRHSAVVNSLTDTLTGLLSKTVSLLVQNQVCPLLSLTASTLDASFIQNIIDKLKPGGEAQRSV